jgi:hypothetical protein
MSDFRTLSPVFIPRSGSHESLSAWDSGPSDRACRIFAMLAPLSYRKCGRSALIRQQWSDVDGRWIHLRGRPTDAIRTELPTSADTRMRWRRLSSHFVHKSTPIHLVRRLQSDAHAHMHENCLHISLSFLERRPRSAICARLPQCWWLLSRKRSLSVSNWFLLSPGHDAGNAVESAAVEFPVMRLVSCNRLSWFIRSKTQLKIWPDTLRKMLLPSRISSFCRHYDWLFWQLGPECARSIWGGMDSYSPQYWGRRLCPCLTPINSDTSVSVSISHDINCSADFSQRENFSQ